jgi:GAF domain-containing protein/HAMP domain-containing protein
MIKTMHTLPPREETLRQAVLVSRVTAVNTVFFIVLGVYLTLTTGTWQAFAFSGIAIAAETAVIVAALPSIQRGHLNKGGWTLLGSALLATALISFLYVSIGYVAVAYNLVAGFFFIRYVLPRESRRLAMGLTVVEMVISIAVEVLNPAWRQVSPLMLTISPILTATLGTAFIFTVARQVWGRSMRNKLLVSFIGVTLAGTGVLAVYAYISTVGLLRQSIEKEIYQHTHGVADQISAVLNEQVDVLTALSLNRTLQYFVEVANRSYRDDLISIQTTLGVRDARWRSADAANNDDDPLVREYLRNAAAVELLEFQKSFPNHVEIFITDVYGGLAGTTNRTSDYYQADEGWWQAAYNNGAGAVYISEPEFDESAGTLAVLIAMPIRDRNTGEITGILRTTFQTSALAPTLRETIGSTGVTDLFIPGNTVHLYRDGKYEPFDSESFEEILSATHRGMTEMNYEGVRSMVLRVPVQNPEGNPAVNKLGWMIVFHQDRSDALAPISAQIRGAFIVITVVLVMAIGVASVVSLLLVRPILQLTQTAGEIAGGNLNSRAKTVSDDEIGVLAATFNDMTSQLQETLQGLEQRVAARTRDLEIVAEVGTAAATILDSKRLLQDVTDLTKERFRLYHSHIYLLDEEGKNLILAAGAGEPGRIMVSHGHSIPLDREQSLVARAARERKGVAVNDVTQAPDFLPNPLLPDTRAELAVPMIAAGKVIGVFDIQSEQIGRFTDADINIQTTLAAQLAVAIQNARSFEQSKRQAEFQSLVNRIGSRIQRAVSIEEALQTAVRELGTAIGASRVRTAIAVRPEDDPNGQPERAGQQGA